MMPAVVGCAPRHAVKEDVPPRGYVSKIRLDHNGRRLHFGPFVGYYFKPSSSDRLDRLHFICFNERQFYTRDTPDHARLFEGEAVLTDLPPADFEIPRASRIQPVYFNEAPAAWTASRPEPGEEYLHFHSCWNAAGAVQTGYWLRHRAVTNFTYDMGGRVGSSSPLYHEVTAGVDTGFAQIIEFDHGLPEANL